MMMKQPGFDYSGFVPIPYRTDDARRLRDDRRWTHGTVCCVHFPINVWYRLGSQCSAIWVLISSQEREREICESECDAAADDGVWVFGCGMWTRPDFQWLNNCIRIYSMKMARRRRGKRWNSLRSIWLCWLIEECFDNMYLNEIWNVDDASRGRRKRCSVRDESLFAARFFLWRRQQ